MEEVIVVEHLSKRYRLGTVGSGTLRDDAELLWRRITGRKSTENDKDKYHDALKDVSFIVRRGEVVGLIGKNGAGKSTLLKILSKVTAPTKGTVKIKGRMASLLEVGTGFHPELTGLENIYLNGAILGMTRSEIRRKQDEIIEFAGIEKYIHTPVKRYSSGMYVRLAFAVAAHLEPDILVVDEVLAVGDIEFQKKCLGKMGEVSHKEGRTIIFVSHNMSAIRQLCTRCLLMEKGQLVYDGSLNEGVEKYTSLNTRIRFEDISNLEHRRNAPEKIHITGINLEDSEKSTRKEFYLFEEFCVKIDFEASDFLSNVCVLIGILHLNGHVAASVSSQDFKQLRLNIHPGKGSVRVVINQSLAPGEYTLAIGICKLDGNHCFDYLENVGEFSVLSVDKSGMRFFPWNNYGSVTFISTWEFSPNMKILV
ncbi:MAG: ABC transporter ATP-binding protein [Flavobacteriales bacterium]|nr:ABC transporter ATP-binding protein [Flavobacteriales bacterium]